VRVEDILEAIGVAPTPPARPEPVGDAAAVLAALRDGSATADELVGATGLSAGCVASALTELELEGLVVLGDGAYRATIAA
jgi:predicted Rossmann fold nucleotide-binding protein DprA/Smf involved in DNA uptake